MPQLFPGGLELTAILSENGLHGSVSFRQTHDSIDISVDVSTEEEWNWSIRHFPIDYTEISDRCTDKKLGKSVYDLNSLFGKLDNSTKKLNASLDVLPIIGDDGIWSRSLFLKTDSGKTACASIIASGTTSVRVAQADFLGESAIIGRVLIQWLGSISDVDALFYTDLTYSDNTRRTTDHEWRIYTTDILDSERDKARSDCNSLQVILLDLTARVGRLKVNSKALSKDQFLPRIDLRSSRQHFLVLLDNNQPDIFLTCARLSLKPPTLLKGVINSKSVEGWFSFEQTSVLSPTKIKRKLTKLFHPVMGGFRVHSLPALPPLAGHHAVDRCSGIGDVFNPTDKLLAADAPFPGEESQEKYAIGDLSGKLGYSLERNWDSFLPLTGKHSIFFRTLVLYRNGLTGVEEPWICVTLLRYSTQNLEQKLPIKSAEAVYRYPLVGRLVFFQVGTEETTVLVEGLVHADGTSLNMTREHRWAVTINPPGADFYNWTARCVSAGPAFNPYLLNTNKSMSGVVGALSDRHQTLTIAGSKKKMQISRHMFTDRQLSLVGRYSILGKSLVIFDDHGPKARGERLACSKISSIFRRKAVVRDWFGNGIPSSLNGKIEFYQQNEYTMTDVEVNLDGLRENGTYRVHMTPVLEILEFPCEESTLYSVYSPQEVNKESGYSPIRTPDSYEVGDLSGKFGQLSAHHAETHYNDSNLFIFGQTSLLGRSVVFHSPRTDQRVACGTIERGYAPSESREIRAIASFHHPDGFAWGYIKMTQLIHFDGSSSDTVLEVNLRHPGKNDRNLTTGHNWAIYVNPVGVDASVKILHTRCTAAGYVWNPYYTQLADPLNTDLYKEECGPDLPLRCYVGDVSSRLGTIDLGKDRKVFSDPNIPLEGKISAMGKSIVILNKGGGPEKFACANIEPDYDTVKYVNIHRPPKFVVSQFLDEVRDVMGIPEWFLTVDSRKTSLLYNGACVQLYVHFKGPVANRLEQDFSRLLSSGKLKEQSIWIPGHIPTRKKKTSISHRLCPSGYSADSSNRLSSIHFSSNGVKLQKSTMMIIMMAVLQIRIYFS